MYFIWHFRYRFTQAHFLLTQKKAINWREQIARRLADRCHFDYELKFATHTVRSKVTPRMCSVYMRCGLYKESNNNSDNNSDIAHETSRIPSRLKIVHTSSASYLSIRASWLMYEDVFLSERIHNAEWIVCKYIMRKVFLSK